MHNDLPYNFVRLTGNLGADPKARVAGSTAVTNFDIAVSTGKDEKKQTHWFPVVCFGELATSAEQELQKGSRVCIEGRLVMRHWKAQDGTNRKGAEVIANEYEIQERRDTQQAEEKIPEATDEPELGL